MHTQERLIAELRSAFAAVERKPDGELFAERDDPLWSEGLHGGRGPWWEVSSEALAHEPHALDELTIDGFRFFLPAYLAWTIMNARSAFSTADTVIYQLDVTGCEEPVRANRLARYRSLSAAQSAAVQRFLAWAVTSESGLDGSAASRAVTGYWSSV